METMGYKDDFYVKKNIIGWTGDINGDEFSVYFADCDGSPPPTVRIADVDQIVVQYGHITQKHVCAYNVGREEVHECFSYAIYNGTSGSMEESELGPQGKDKLDTGKRVDKSDHEVLHQSRGVFHPVTKGTIDRLAALIPKFTSIKTRYTDSEGFEKWKKANGL
jgi:hypothetical protein